jgi:hypothetical protein
MAAAYAQAIQAGAAALAARYAPEIEAWMKQNAIWTDRTGNARQTLSAEAAELSAGLIEITLSHGVEYGIWLELAHGGSYAIIGPAIDYFAPRIWADVQRMVR